MDAHTIGRWAGIALLAAAAGTAQAQATNSLRVEADAAGSFDRSHDWSIDKQVTPASADRFIGETQELAFTLALTRSAPRDAAFRVTGTALIANDSAVDATVTAITITYGGVAVNHACATGPLAAGASRTCALSFDATDAEARALVVEVDTSGAVAGAAATDLVAFAAPVVTGATITVQDPLLPAPLTFDASGTHAYTHAATCIDGNTVVVENTATIVETGASDSATARIACHASRMERTVASFGNPDWTWTLSKTHSTPLPLQAVAGQAYDIDYTITATATAGNSRVVHGAISVLNTHPSSDAVVNSVQARINATDATVTCPTPMIAPHATYDANSNIVVGRLTCPFTVTLAPGETPSTVTGRVEHQLFDYDSAGVATAGDIRLLQGTQPVPSLPAGESRDECIALVDVYLGQTHDLGEFCAAAGNTTVTRRFTGAIRVTEDSECEFAVPNLARLTTNDSGTRVEASTSVTVERSCTASAPTGVLELDISGSGAFSRFFPWTIEKSVTPAASNRFVGETQELEYTLTLTKGSAQDAGFRVTGTATIANTAATVADITAIDIAYGDVAVAHSCATGALAAGATRTCALDFQTASDTPRLLSLRVTTSGDVAGGAASNTVSFNAPVTTGNSITVADTQLAANVNFTESGTHRYTHDATCQDGNPVVVDNTATIVETGASDSAQARVTCRALQIELSATTAGGLSYAWNLEKTHGQTAPVRLNAGESRDVSYAITATATPSGGSAGSIVGSVTVANPDPANDAVIVSVQAWINDTPVTVRCPTPMLAPRGGKLVCPFTATLAAGEAAATVRGRVEQQRFDYDHDNLASAAGTNVLEATQPVTVAVAGMPTDACVTLTDVYLGAAHDLGEFCAAPDALSVTRTFVGRITLASDTGCDFTIANAATLVANDSGASAEASTSVAVQRVDCDVVEPAGNAAPPQGPVTIPAASTPGLVLLALVLALGAMGILSRRGA